MICSYTSYTQQLGFAAWSNVSRSDCAWSFLDINDWNFEAWSEIRKKQEWFLIAAIHSYLLDKPIVDSPYIDHFSTTNVVPYSFCEFENMHACDDTMEFNLVKHLCLYNSL